MRETTLLLPGVEPDAVLDGAPQRFRPPAAHRLDIGINFTRAPLPRPSRGSYCLQELPMALHHLTSLISPIVKDQLGDVFWRPVGHGTRRTAQPATPSGR